MPGEVALDPTKRYFISILPGDAANLERSTAPSATPWAARRSSLERVVATGRRARATAPIQTAKISVFVFQDDNPLNGENDTGGGVDVLAPNEAGLGGFNIVLIDQAGAFGDPAGQITYDMFRHAGDQLAGGQDRPGHRQQRVPDLDQAHGRPRRHDRHLPEVRVPDGTTTTCCRRWPATP